METPSLLSHWIINPNALTVIIWLIVALILTGGEELLAALAYTPVVAFICGTIVALAYWLFNKFSWDLLLGPQIWLPAGILALLGTLTALIFIFRSTEGQKPGGIQDREKSINVNLPNLGCVLEIIGLVASILGIITFIIEYLL